MSQQRRALIDSAVIFLIACWLIAPLFKVEYFDNWGSIESTFIADARMLREHLPHPGWQPLWYCGTRFDYIYPPALRYGTALISFAGGVSTARAYHLDTAFFYAAGIVGVYWLAWAGSRSRIQAWLASVATALFSPCFLLMADLRMDSPHWVPQRLHAMATYGEGPHISALSILGWALAAACVALRERRPRELAAAGILCGGVAATNFYGAIALAMFFPILAWGVWLELRRPVVWLRAAAIAILAYCLCAFWLTPSYIHITAVNMRWVSEPSKPSSVAIAIGCVAFFCIATLVIAKYRPVKAWPVFVAGSVLVTAIYVLGWDYFGLRIAGSAYRIAPELDLALTLFVVWCMALMWKRRRLRPIVILLLSAACYPASRYILKRKSPFPPANAAAVAARPEYQITKWMAANLPGARALPSGSIRYWYNAWYDNEEAYGGSNQGMQNQILPAANYQINQGQQAELAILWLQTLGVEAVIVPDKTSKEMFHDYSHPEKFHNALAEIYNDHEGNVIYRVPRRFPSIARVVDRAALMAVGTPRTGDDRERLMGYVSVIESGPDTEAKVSRPSPDAFDVDATLAAGQAVLLQETFDRAWHADADGKALPIEQDPLGFMLIAASPGAHSIHLRFRAPLENRIGWGFSIVAAGAIGMLIFTPRGLNLYPKKNDGGEPARRSI